MREMGKCNLAVLHTKFAILRIVTGCYKLIFVRTVYN